MLLAVGSRSLIAENYDFQKERWQRAAKMPTPRWGAELAVLEGQASVIDGRTDF